jgi:hypothetical protein
MAADDTIARMGVELYTDTEAFVDNLESSFTRAFEVAKDSVERAVDDINETIAKGLSDEDLGQRIANVWAGVGKGTEEAKAFLEGFAEVTGKTTEELNALGTAYTENLKDRLADALAVANTELQDTNALSEQTIKNLRSLADEAGRMAGADKSLASGAQAAKQLAEQYGEVSEKAGLMKVATSAANKVLAPFGLSVASFTTAVGAATAAVTLYWKGLQELQKELAASYDLAMRLAEVNFRLEVSARAAQRSIGEEALSIKEAKGFARELADTYAQSIVTTTALTGKAIQLTSEMGMTGEQVKDLTKAAVVLNETLGMDSMSALTMLTMYIQTGYGRALARQGFDVSRAAQQQEAYALGIRKPLKELTEQEKQLVRTSLIMRQVNKYSEDAVAGQENLGKALAHANRRLESQREEIANLIGNIGTRWKVLWIEARANIDAGIAGIIKGLVVMASAWVAAWATMAKAWDDFKKGQFSITNLAGDFQKAWGLAFNDLTAGINTLGDAFGGAADSAEQFEQRVDEAMLSVQSEIDDLTERLNEFGDDVAKMNQEAADAIDEVWKNAAQDKLDAEVNYQRDIRDIDENAAQDRLRAIHDYQVDEVRMRQDHERRLKELENQYLFDLMDAVRERDALQVLMLQRRYNLEKQKEEDAFDLASQRRKEDYERELAEIAYQAALKKALRWREFQEQLADIDAQAAIREAKIRDTLAKEIQALKDELMKMGVDIINMLIAAGVDPQVVAEIGKRLGMQFGASMGAEAATQFDKTFTPYVTAYMANVANAMRKAFSGGIGGNVGPNTATGGIAGGGAGSYAPYTSPGSQKRILGFATGGDFIASSPQRIQVGERPERVTITPLNAGTGAPLAGFGGGGRGKIGVKVAIDLSAGLEGRIVDQTLSEVADVIVTLNRDTDSRPLGGSR